MPGFDFFVPKYNEDHQKLLKDLYNAYVDNTQQLQWLLSNLDQKNITDVRGINGWKIFNRKGINPRFIKAFPNKCRNSSFEIFNATTKVPTYWSAGESTNTAAFDGTYSLKLTAGQASRTTGYTLNPQWWITVTGGSDDITKTRVSFYQKGGSAKVEVLNVSSGDAPFTLKDEAGNTGTSITYSAVSNWGPASLRTITFEHGSSTNISLKLTNMEASNACYIDAVCIEPDFTGEWPSFYTAGPNSLANSKGGDLTTETQIYVQDDEPTDAVEKDVWIDTDDYSRYDKTALTGNTTLNTSDNEFLTASGAFTITLHAGTAAGIIKKIYNIGTGLVTIAGTINGEANMYLYPGESVELITDGTNWRY